MTRRKRLLDWLRRLKTGLATGSSWRQLTVPLIEVLEFSLSHGPREVVRRARLRLRANAWRLRPELPGPPQAAGAAPAEAGNEPVDVKLIAFYLPQYHPIPENDAAWGKGFTEWTNVTRARPLFNGHYQPHLPADLGFYDLRVPETRDEQARLARSYGIFGFCYYYYWFDPKRLLSRPFDEMLRTGQPDYPFCICWANEPWSRRWDGSSHEIIAPQDYRDGYEERFIADVMPALRDPRYVRVDARPLLVVYRLDQLPDPAAAVDVWRAACRRDGVGEICLAAMGTEGTTDPRASGFDLSIEFPPHNLTFAPTIEDSLQQLDRDFEGRVFDYTACAEAELRRRPSYPQFRGLMTSWDNTARRGKHAMLFHKATPGAYEVWLGGLLELAKGASAPHSPLVFINAWNEWAEGAHLEPDQKYGVAYLEATASALLRHRYSALFARGFESRAASAAHVAIVIPVHNQAALTVACLDSLARHRSQWQFEVIVVDDGSTDVTNRLLESIPGLHVIRSEQNRGFIRSSNAGAAATAAEYLVFLNNDTVVQDGWLDELRSTFDEWPGAGLVGSKLVWPNGRLQECGSFIYRDGSAENYGREGDPSDPRFCYARETDYVSGAAMMIPHDLFAQVGGFDEAYDPAYYEDVDLAFKVRRAGRRVIVNPCAVVIHHEGGTAGLDVTVGAKRHQVINQATFRTRWESVLDRFPEQAGRQMPTERNTRILVIDWTVPRPDRDAGSVRMIAILKILKRLGHTVTFVSRDGAYDPRYGIALERMGVEVLRHPYIESVERYLEVHGAEFGHVVVSRRDVATLHLHAVKKFCPGARLIFDTVDLHFMREERWREMEAEQTASLATHFADGRRREVEAITAADVTLVVSEYERDVLKSMFNGIDVRVVSLVHEPRATPRAFAERAGLLFVGYFVHTPNSDAVRWFVKEVLPLIQIDDPGFRVHIVGSDPPDDIVALASDRVLVHGYVADLDGLFDQCKLSVAPLRYGAGLKGKIGQSLALGVPCVTTSIGAEGMSLENGISGMVADTASQFAASIEQVYRDEALWMALRQGGLALIAQKLSVEAAHREVVRLFSSRPLTPEHGSARLVENLDP